jgi:methylmalonyl-CoA mutase N-terminal domain/subunit
VGVNTFVEDGAGQVAPPVLAIDTQVESDQRARVAAFRNGRDTGRAEAALNALRGVAEGTQIGLMAAMVECVRSSCTLGEISDVLRGVFGEYHGE